MRIRVNQLRQRLDDWQLPIETLAARALRLKPEEIVSARLLRKSVDARDKGDVHFSLTLEAETARPVRLPKNAEEIKNGIGDGSLSQKNGIRNRPLSHKNEIRNRPPISFGVK